MFAGHLGAALALKRADRTIGLGALVLAALWLDVVLWTLVLAGVETVTIPPDYRARHYATFVFPWSHGLLASLGWSAGAAIAALAVSRGRLRGHRPGSGSRRAAAVLALAVFSHWVLDALVHIPELPVAGARSPRIGLGLWERMPAAILVETAVAGGGLWLALGGARVGRWRAAGLAILALLVTGMTIAGTTIAPAPPGGRAMAVASLASLAVVISVAGWLDGGSERRRAA